MLNLKVAFCLWLGCCSGAQFLTRPTLVQTEARKWVFFFRSKVISIIITKSTAVRTRSTEHGCALSVKWLLCNLHDNKAVHGGRDRNEGRWWGSHTYLSKQKAEQVRAKFCYNLSCTKKLQAPTRGNRCVCVPVCVCAPKVGGQTRAINKHKLLCSCWTTGRMSNASARLWRVARSLWPTLTVADTCSLLCEYLCMSVYDCASWCQFAYLCLRFALIIRGPHVNGGKNAQIITDDIRNIRN